MSGELDGKQPVGQGAPGHEGQSDAATPGRSTLLEGALGVLGGMSPVGAGVAAGRYLGSVFSNHPANQGAQGAPQGGGSTSAATAGAPTTAAPATENISASPGSPAFRVQTAAAANNLAQVVAIQTELLHQPRTAEIEAGIAAARHWLMEQVAAVRDRHAAALTAAQASSRAGNGSGLGAVEQVEIDMDRECGPFLTALAGGDPQLRYEHPNHDITAKVFSAVRLHGARSGLSHLNNANAEQQSDAAGGLTAGQDWCGAFAFMIGGMDGAWASNMGHEHRIRDSLNYQHPTKWIWTGAEWKDIRLYHRDRGSERYYRTVDPGQPVPPIEPGDIVLKDLIRGTDPDHITTALTGDGQHLQTIGGNEGAQHPVNRTGTADLAAQGAPVDARERGPNGQPIPETNVASVKRGHERVHGIGRWSIVDYEQHSYSSAATRPTAPPPPRR